MTVGKGVAESKTTRTFLSVVVVSVGNAVAA